MADERTTAYLMGVLGQDCQRCANELLGSIDAGESHPDGTIAADYEYHARQLIRSIFAYIEAVTFSVKIKSIDRCDKAGIDSSPEERAFAGDVDFEVTDKGEVVESVAKISLARNIRFAINLNRRAYNVDEPFDASVEWWSCLKAAIRVRDRLTHPKMPEDVDISGDDISNAMTARNGFEDEMIRWSRRAP